MASYLHCGTCRRAFDASAGATCPSCAPAPASPDSLATATAALAAALAGATPAERAQVADALARALGIVPAPAAPLPVRAGFDVVARPSLVEILRRRVRRVRRMLAAFA